ncbi:uncharacterized protein LOC125880185 [Epinephelus fuscoguttatus]|uniref:uncharacterized protein LOC125880185 n=1 Tax=Epinephelus fuscoguttatus TaxID=293821 RepID=UPI0020D19170|nr:uncharacterized protein LOC125880185 [Epinephelus fuscoguttatus]
METRNPRPSPQGPVSQDGSGLWMKMESHPVTDHTESPSVTRGEKPQDESEITPPAPAVITRYYSVMDDEGADEVFIPPPPSYMAPLLPAEGGTDTEVNNSTVTLTEGAADATEAEANPSGLDWHHSDKHLMAAQKVVDEVIEGAAQASKESMDTVSLSKDQDSTLSKRQDQASMEEACYDPCRRHNQENATGDEESNEDHEDIAILNEGQKNWRNTEAESDQYPKQEPTGDEENSENETLFDKEEDKTKSNICGRLDSKLTTEDVDYDNAETNAPKLSNPHASDDDFESCRPTELCECSQNTTDTATNQSQVPEIPTEASNDDEEHVDTRSLNYTLTKYNWARRESGTIETQVSQLSISEGYEKMAPNEEQEDGSRRIATDIQQGAELLQRLQLVQLRQEDTRGETRGMPGTDVDDLKARQADLTGGDGREESRIHSAEDEGAKMNLKEKEENEKNESKDAETKARTSSSTLPVESEHHAIAAAEGGDSDGDQRDSCVPEDLLPIDPRETSSPLVSTCHRFSVAETSMERQIHEEVQGIQSLQRAGGVFNLADNPDVLEIPFKTNILLEPLSSKDDPDQRTDWQFSEQKMKKEISQEIQRELVLVNQGKIPGGYSKGEVRQLKETKLLFEAFQQDNTGGPTRNRKPPASLMKGHVYPSVLERTRSLELLSHKSCPVSRTHSLRLCKETEKSPEILRSRSPTGGSRDKTRLAPYAKQDKHTRPYKSMDSINTDVSMPAVETRSKSREGNLGIESPILKQNPFFKLRPALALQPEVEKDIREAKEREEELRRQRCTLYGENRQNSEDGDKSRFNPTLESDVRKLSRGKLERVWPPPSKKDQMKSEQTQQEPKVHRAGGQKAPLWQRWESGLINGKPSN